MIYEETLSNILLGLCVIVGILLTMYFAFKSFQKKPNKGLKSFCCYVGVNAILSAICAFLLFWLLHFLIGIIVSYCAIEIKEILCEDDTYDIVVKYYFDKSKIPAGQDSNVLNESGIHYFNNTTKEVAYFSRTYYSEMTLKVRQSLKKMNERQEEKPLDLIHMNNPRVEYDTLRGVIIKPSSFFNMTRRVDCAFKPSPTSITVTRSKNSKYKTFDSDSITILDVKDSLISHHGVVIRVSQ